MPLPASAISVRRRFLAARDVRVMHFHLPGQHDQQDHAGGTAAPDGTVAHFSPDDGGVLFHGTREPSAVYRPKEGQELYLTDDYGEASGYATGAHLGGRGRVPTVVKLEVRPGRTADVNDEVNELIVNGSPDDLQKLFAGYRERGYRYVTYEHPSFIHDDREQRVVVSLFPHEDVKSRGGWRVGGAKTSHARFFANPERVLRFAAPSRAASRCNFAAIKQREDALAKTAVPEAANAVARGVKRMLGDDAQLAALLDDDPQDIAALSMNGADVGRVRAAFDGALETAYETGRVTGANELSRAGRPLTFAALREKAAGYIAANGFRMAENVSEATRAVIQGELLTGVKSGKRPAAVREAIWNGLVAKGLTSREAALGVETDEAVVGALNELWVEDEPEAAHYLDTLVRTNSFEAMNEARYAEFTDPEVRGFVQALEYSAILDSNTTPICEHLDGRVYRADNEEVWNKFRPPNHYNCRSVLIPVTAIDGWDGAESEEPSVEPQAGFFTRWDEGEHLRGKISDKDTSAGELFTHERFTRRAPLYVNRQLLNPEPFIEWAREAGFEQTLSPDDLHVTVAFSREPVDWEAPPDAERLVMVQGGTRTVESLGDEGAVVLRFESPELQARWQALRDAGASWDYEEYQPHITITYAKPEGLQLEKITPYAGDLEFGPERFEPLDTESVEKIVEDKL